MIFKALLMMMLLMFLFACQQNSPNWESINTGLMNDYPDVQHISTDAFVEEYINDALLIDVREPTEYAISHIPGAINLTHAQAIADYIETQNKPIVVYCSAGYRSAAVARELAQYGVHNVLNMQGSIFAWANEGRELVNKNGVTNKVHPYDDHWAKLLDKSVPAVY